VNRGRVRSGTGRRILLAALLGALSLSTTVAWASARPAAHLTRVSGLPASLAAPGSVKFTLAAHGSRKGRVEISAWLSPVHRGAAISVPLSRHAISIRPHATRRFKLKARIPANVASGTYRMLLCAGRRKRAHKPPRHGCLRSKPFTITSGGKIVPVKIIIGTNPITVTPTLDTAAAKTTTIGSSGGTLTDTAHTAPSSR
jgi:hypothetical protein